jgi:hypothetical protein
MLVFQVHPIIELTGTIKDTKIKKVKQRVLTKPNEVELHLPFLVYCLTKIGTFVSNLNQHPS